MPDTPGWELGIKAKDMLFSVNEIDVRSLPREQILPLFQSRPVNVTFQRPEYDSAPTAKQKWWKRATHVFTKGDPSNEDSSNGYVAPASYLGGVMDPQSVVDTTAEE